MTPVQIVNSILVLILPIMIWLGYWIAQFGIQRMPGPQSAKVESFSRIAAHYVEREHANALDKKVLCVACVVDMFKAYSLPVPPKEILSVAASAALYEVEQNG